jgi:hypothetical protein
MFLETRDGLAILGYAGLGATAAGVEPADWMSSVLRGRNLPLEQSLGVLADAMKRQLPRHMLCIPGKQGPAHNVLAPAILENDLRMYTIDLAFAPNRKNYRFRYTGHVVDKPALVAPRTPRVAVGGSGGLYLVRNKRWIRPLLRMVKANDRGQVSTNTLAAHFASLNNEVHKGIQDRSVGPRCIVAWRHRKHGLQKGGGGHQFFTGSARDRNCPSLPTIAIGMDVHAICEVLMRHFMKDVEGMRTRCPAAESDTDELYGLNAELARLPGHPNEDLP